jgi:S1-C subfamily serine protease
MSRTALLSSLALAASLFLAAPSLLAQSGAAPPPADNPAELPPLPREGGSPSASPKAAPKAPPPRPVPAPKPPPPSKLSPEIRRLSDTFAQVAEKVSPSVVQIDVTTLDSERASFRWLKNDNVQRGLGSGVIFSSDGAVLTNNHVIEEARAINIRLRDGRTFAARLVGRDPSTDLAVLRIDARDLPAATFADSDGARVGAWVLAIGSPFGLGHTVTSGVLSAKGRGGMGINAVEDYLQTDASINPGNSGGPLVDLDGRVLGINTMIVSRGQGIGLAVPAGRGRGVGHPGQGRGAGLGRRSRRPARGRRPRRVRRDARSQGGRRAGRRAGWSHAGARVPKGHDVLRGRPTVSTVSRRCPARHAV